MNNLSHYLSMFLREYLPCVRGVSQHTSESYAYTFQLLVCFASKCAKTQPSKLTLELFDVPLIIAFLNHLEKERGNSARTRNARLAAIKSFFHFLEYRIPSCLEQAGSIRAIPTKKTDEKLIDYLSKKEMQALLDSTDIHKPSGIRDRAMIYLVYSAGLRVSELVELKVEQLNLNPSPTIHVHGKGRKERIIPLWKETANALRSWIKLRKQKTTTPELFLNNQGNPFTRSGFEYILSKYVKKATKKQPSLANKRISPHVLRHTCAMHTLQATHDIRKVSLWLGHEDLKSTEIYLRADPSKKLEALMSNSPLSLRKGNFKNPDRLLAMLKSHKCL